MQIHVKTRPTPPKPTAFINGQRVPLITPSCYATREAREAAAAAIERGIRSWAHTVQAAEQT